jgi:UDP-N-acetylmuramate--alanine ligase
MTHPTRIHFVGIGGIGMSALAKILLEGGYQVSGSDLKLSPITAKLQEMGARVFERHRPEHIGEAELIVVTSAAPKDNPEIVAGRARGIPIIKGSEMLGRMMEGKMNICVAGTHGKTTTTAMIAKILVDAGLDPTFVVGGEVQDLGTNGRLGHGPHFVAEADEYDRRFLELNPRIAVITNIEADHLDYYGTFDALVEGFRAFVDRLPQDGALVACWDDPETRRLAKMVRQRNGNGPRVVTYGLERSGQWWATNVRQNEHGGHDFVAWHLGRRAGAFRLVVPGRHNVANALAALAVARLLDLDLKQAGQSLATYTGTRRRFEIKGQVGGVTVVDDYAHHPTEIRATLAAARERFPGQELWVIFQPHTYSRTKHLMAEFAEALALADHVVVTEVYAAREHDTLGVSGADIVAHMEHPDARFVPELDEAAKGVTARMKPGDVLLTLGAGDVWCVGESVMGLLK